MKKLELNQMETFQGGSGKGCFIGGVLAGFAFYSGFFTGGAGFLAAAAIASGGAYAGCFD
tara:strand:+ start:434 stop:613 length:180 start_codon:yes stop_codon:yes gene_type:complete